MREGKQDNIAFFYCRGNGSLGLALHGSAILYGILVAALAEDAGDTYSQIFYEIDRAIPMVSNTTTAQTIKRLLRDEV